MDDDREFAVHLSPTDRDRADFIIAARIDGSETSRKYEQLWVRQLGGEKFELCCIPFFLYDLALGDHVTTATIEGRQYMLDTVVKPSGGYTFRAWFGDSLEPEEAKRAVAANLAQRLWRFEWYSENLLAIAAVDVSEAREIESALTDWEQAGLLLYETGYGG